MSIYFTYLSGFLLGFILLSTLPIQASELNESSTVSNLSNDYLLKSAFLLNLVRFIEWPDEPMPKPKPLYFCFFGNDSFGSALDSIREKTVRGRELIIKKNIAFHEIIDCHLLFIDASKRDELLQILETTANHPILTVGDMPDFATEGGLVNLINYQERIMLEINIDAAQRTQLRISSRLLSLARLIEEKRSK